MLRAIQNTIYAQVEGELYFHFSTDFPMYPDFQTRERLIHAILMGAKRLGFDTEKLTQMLGETKQVCYNPQQHTVHMFFWTREAGTGWAKVFGFIPFRNRRFVLRNARPEEDHPSDTPEQRSKRMWQRQFGVDGMTNEKRHDRYRVKFLNVSRFMDEAALDAYIRSKFSGSYATFQEPKYGRQTFQTGAWEIFFKTPGCPAFLEKIRFIDWMGKKILVHHAGTNPAPPCYNCGNSGHTVVECKSKQDAWKRGNGCITVTTEEVMSLDRHKLTITSIQELEQMWEAQAELKIQEQKVDSSKETYLGQKAPEQMKEGQPSQPDSAKQTKEWQTPSRKKSFRPGRSIQEAIREERDGQQETIPSDLIDVCSATTDEEDTEDNTEPTGIVELKRPEVLSKQTRLIEEAVNKSKMNPQTDQQDLMELEELEFKETLTGYDVLRHCGLNPESTPPTGNCQFYGIAMALLNSKFETAAKTAIENITAKVKKGLVMAAQHGFEVEFPHETRKALVSSKMESAGELTINESKKRLQEYLQGIGSSSSKSNAFLSRSYWGSELTLLMIAKLLTKPIYLVVRREGLNKASYQIFRPMQKTTKTHELDSAGEFNFRPEEAEKWITELKKDRKEAAETGHFPVVLHFGGVHYT
ncbi:hypothetical protein P3T76_008343 [Phytophthora citrophthora]|uniref:CCHC-type domain-containing protein n=1 Tax=Phytophthora citrophthora TaxID=4793 RepID=A0AAD9GK79_9STRA|nr:hypothetical protein P3T76_008343 [Phytophthora citrophthora]